MSVLSVACYVCIAGKAVLMPVRINAISIGRATVTAWFVSYKFAIRHVVVSLYRVMNQQTQVFLLEQSYTRKSVLLHFL